MTERASQKRQSRSAAISRFFVRARLSQDAFVYVSILALSGAHAPEPGCGSQRLLRFRLHPAGRGPNSFSLFPPLAAVVAVAPRGRAIGRPDRFLLDEQSFILSGTVVPCGLDSRQLYKARFFRSLCPRKRGPAFCASIRFQRPVQSVPARQCLSLWERCHRR